MDHSVPDKPIAPGVLLGTWCKALFQALQRQNVRDVVISPGSRNTPLTAIAVASPSLTCHSVIDERSAAFFALGLAKGSRAPVALLCTSGTAGAHYYPALIEASYDSVPLVAITADRPLELQNCGAPQTIAQANLYGGFVRAAYQTADPIDLEDAFLDLAKQVAKAAAASCGARPGPVHINVPLRKPLEPQEAGSTSDRLRVEQLLSIQGHADARLSVSVDSDDDFHSRVRVALAEAQRPLLSSGPLPPREQNAVERLAEEMRAPLVGDFARSPHGAGLDLISRLLRSTLTPDLVIHFGPPSVSTAWADFVQNFAGEYFVVSGFERKDPSRRARNVATGSLLDRAMQLHDVHASSRAADYLGAMRSAFGRISNAISWEIHAQELHAESVHAQEDSEVLPEPLAVKSIIDACTKETQLLLGNSLPLRIASWVWTTCEKAQAPFTTRGVNGIDGTIAQAAGLCAAAKRPTVALVGDVAAAHDIGGLALSRNLPAPLIVVVLDNAGGRIFEHLPVRKTISNEHFRYFTTPPGIDWEKAAGAFGIAFLQATTKNGIRTSLAGALSGTRPLLLHVPVRPNSSIAFLERLREKDFL